MPPRFTWNILCLLWPDMNCEVFFTPQCSLTENTSQWYDSHKSII